MNVTRYLIVLQNITKEYITFMPKPVIRSCILIYSWSLFVESSGTYWQRLDIVIVCSLMLLSNDSFFYKHSGHIDLHKHMGK